MPPVRQNPRMSGSGSRLALLPGVSLDGICRSGQLLLGVRPELLEFRRAQLFERPGGGQLHLAEALAEAQIAAAQGHLGIDAQVPPQIDDGEEKIAEFGLDSRPANRNCPGFGLQLGRFFNNLGKQVAASWASRSRRRWPSHPAWRPRPGQAWRAARCRGGKPARWMAPCFPFRRP